MATYEEVEGLDTSVSVARAVPLVGVTAPRVSWGAIIAGAVAAVGIWALLYAFGLAVGLSAVDPQDPGSVRSSGLFTGLWSVITPLIALFVGGLVASQAAGVLDRTTGVIHGLVVWGLTLLLGTWLVGSVLGNVVSGVASLGRTAVQAGGGAIANVAERAGELSQTFGIDANDALAPVNQRLQAEGMPPVREEEVQAATRDVVQTAIREGRVDRNTIVTALAQRTSLSAADAEEVASRIEAQITQARGKAAQLAEQARTGALKAADATGKAFWGVFGALLLGLVASILGAILGTRRRQQQYVTGAAPETRRGPVVWRERPGEI